MIALVLAAAVFAAVWIPRAVRHDRNMAALENLDDEELAAVLEVDPHYIERMKQW